jgi:hypothetical protein
MKPAKHPKTASGFCEESSSNAFKMSSDEDDKAVSVIVSPVSARAVKLPRHQDQLGLSLSASQFRAIKRVGNESSQ